MAWCYSLWLFRTFTRRLWDRVILTRINEIEKEGERRGKKVFLLRFYFLSSKWKKKKTKFLQIIMKRWNGIFFFFFSFCFIFKNIYDLWHFFSLSKTSSKQRAEGKKLQKLFARNSVNERIVFQLILNRQEILNSLHLFFCLVFCLLRKTFLFVLVFLQTGTWNCLSLEIIKP